MGGEKFKTCNFFQNWHNIDVIGQSLAVVPKAGLRPILRALPGCGFSLREGES